jgi:hypothetical protein
MRAPFERARQMRAAEGRMNANEARSNSVFGHAPTMCRRSGLKTGSQRVIGGLHGPCGIPKQEERTSFLKKRSKKLLCL